MQFVWGLGGLVIMRWLVLFFLLCLGWVGRGRWQDGLERYTNGCRWCDMPPKYGSYKTAWRGFRS